METQKSRNPSRERLSAKFQFSLETGTKLSSFVESRPKISAYTAVPCCALLALLLFIAKHTINSTKLRTYYQSSIIKRSGRIRHNEFHVKSQSSYQQ